MPRKPEKGKGLRVLLNRRGGDVVEIEYFNYPEEWRNIGELLGGKSSATKKKKETESNATERKNIQITFEDGSVCYINCSGKHTIDQKEAELFTKAEATEQINLMIKNISLIPKDVTTIEIVDGVQERERT